MVQQLPRLNYLIPLVINGILGSHNREIVNCYEFSLKTFHNKKLRVNLSVIKGEGMTNDA
jgi:hypothetical protein